MIDLKRVFNRYFPMDQNFVTYFQFLENVQIFSVARSQNGRLIPCVITLAIEPTWWCNSMKEIADQFIESCPYDLESLGTNTVYAVLIQGSKVAFFTYCKTSVLLDPDLTSYNGLVPLGNHIDMETYWKIKGISSPLSDYIFHAGRMREIEVEQHVLTSLGVTTDPDLKHCSIFDMLNEGQRDYVHRLFQHMGNYSAHDSVKYIKK